MNTVNVDHTTRPSTPATIEDDLKALWRDVAKHTPVTRAAMANLVVFRACGRDDHIDFDAWIGAVPIADVVRHHPSRVIVLHHSPDAGAGAPIAAAVSVVTFGTGQSCYGFEQIAVRSACADASLPSIVRSLMRGDVPTSIWWTEDVSRAAPVGAIVAMGRQLVYDSRDWRDVRRGVLALSPFTKGHGPDLADLNWRRLTALRHALVHASRTMLSDQDACAGDVHVAHGPGEGAVAWLLAGWLASRLTGTSAGRIPVRVEESPHGDEILAVSFGKAPNGLSASMNAQRVTLTAGRGAPPFYITMRQESEAEAVVAELRTLSRDPCLHDALTALARHFAA